MQSHGGDNQPNVSIPNAQERAAMGDTGKQPFVSDESIPAFEKDFKVKEEYFDDEGYMKPWGQKHFVGVPSSNSQPLPKGGLIIRNNYTFSPRQVINDGLTHMGISFQNTARSSPGYSEASKQ